MVNERVLKNVSKATKFIVTILTISMLLSVIFPNYFPVSQKDAASWITSQSYDKLMFVLVQIFQVIVPPISHYFTSILGGYVYGSVLGGVLNWVGRVIGQYCAYYIAFGAGNWMRNKLNWDFAPFEKLVCSKGKGLFWRATAIFAMIALPFFPDDELSYAMGFAKYPLWLFSLVTLFGHLLGSFALAFLGSGDDFKGPLFNGLATITIVIFVVLVVSSIKIKTKQVS